MEESRVARDEKSVLGCVSTAVAAAMFYYLFRPRAIFLIVRGSCAGKPRCAGLTTPGATPDTNAVTGMCTFATRIRRTDVRSTMFACRIISAIGCARLWACVRTRISRTRPALHRRCREGGWDHMCVLWVGSHVTEDYPNLRGVRTVGCDT